MRWLLASLFLATLTSSASAATDLTPKVARLDASVPGVLGVYINGPPEGLTARYHAERKWYLSSTVKIPVAIVVLQQAEKGLLSLDQELTLRQEDILDGSGELKLAEPGGRYSVRDLLRRMLVQSDSTATDMLIRLVGEETLNARLRALAGEGFGRLTTLLQVRRDAYGEVHPRGKRLSNLDFLELRMAGDPAARLQAFMRKLRLRPDELRVRTLEEGFERYYARGLNSSTLSAFGRLLERLNAGALLSGEHTRLLLTHMQNIETGEKRIKSGLSGLPFAQKTGTQIQRICNVGVVQPLAPEATVVLACVEKFGALPEAERTLSRLGGLIAQAFQAPG